MAARRRDVLLAGAAAASLRSRVRSRRLRSRMCACLLVITDEVIE
jgi:hypothetical protein